MDIQNARDELGYEPQYSFHEYLEDYKKEQKLKRFDRLWSQKRQQAFGGENMKCDIAIIGASYLQLPLILKAKEMGFRTHVFAWAAGDVGEKAADVFYPISIIEKEQITEKCRQIGVCGICSIASDLAVVTVNYAAEKLGLCGNSMESTYKSTNKYQMRQAFKKRGDPCPESLLVDDSFSMADLDISFPVIVKPTDRSGSRGIFKVERAEDLEKAVSMAAAQSLEKKALIEEYVCGEEYSVEYISFKGVHSFLAVTKKYTTGAPHFIETGHLEPAPIDEATQTRIKAVVEHALDTLEIKNGASHSEIKIDSSGEIRIIEIGARMGGDCIGSDLVRYSTGYDYLKMVIQTACGEVPDFTKDKDTVSAESLFIFSQADLDELERLRREEPQNLLRIADLHPERIGAITDSSNRAGCYIRTARR